MSFGWRWLANFSAFNQCASAGDGLALNRLAIARNGGGLQVYSGGSWVPCTSAAVTGTSSHPEWGQQRQGWHERRCPVPL